jgi:hypothetical protein
MCSDIDGAGALNCEFALIGVTGDKISRVPIAQICLGPFFIEVRQTQCCCLAVLGEIQPVLRKVARLEVKEGSKQRSEEQQDKRAAGIGAG